MPSKNKQRSAAKPSRSPDSPAARPAQHQIDTATDKPDSLPLGASPLRKGISKQTIIKFALLGAAILALLIYLAWDVLTKGPLMRLLSNRDELVRIMSGLGLWAPLFYIILQVIQVVVAPIPGQVVGGVGGFLFGHWGILWTTVGSFIGFWLVFVIARHFGRPLIEKIFKKPAVDKFDFIINAKGASFIIFAIFLLPGFPDDLVCYIAGLTKLPLKRLMLISILGRFPTIVITNYIGMGISGNIGLVAALSLVAVLIFGLAAWKREQIIAFLKRDNQPKKIENSKHPDKTHHPEDKSK